MTYQTEMEARFGSTTVIRWTNPGSQTATTVGTTALAAVLVDVSGDFRDYAGVVYDDTDNRMIGIACDGGSIYLRRRMSEHGSFDNAWSSYIKRLEDLRKRTNANRLIPSKVLINNVSVDDTNKSYSDQKKLAGLGFQGIDNVRGVRSESDF